LPSESPAFRVEREIGASGKRPTIPEGNGAVARALFGGLRACETISNFPTKYCQMIKSPL
jgi:hypothetical protein